MKGTTDGKRNNRFKRETVQHSYKHNHKYNSNDMIIIRSTMEDELSKFEVPEQPGRYNDQQPIDRIASTQNMYICIHIYAYLFIVMEGFKETKLSVN